MANIEEGMMRCRCGCTTLEFVEDEWGWLCLDCREFYPADDPEEDDDLDTDGEGHTLIYPPGSPTSDSEVSP